MTIWGQMCPKSNPGFWAFVCAPKQTDPMCLSTCTKPPNVSLLRSHPFSVVEQDFIPWKTQTRQLLTLVFSCCHLFPSSNQDEHQVSQGHCNGKRNTFQVGELANTLKAHRKEDRESSSRLSYSCGTSACPAKPPQVHSSHELTGPRFNTIPNRKTVKAN